MSEYNEWKLKHCDTDVVRVLMSADFPKFADYLLFYLFDL